MKYKSLFICLILLLNNSNCVAEQITSKYIPKITTTITAPLSGEKGKHYFVCSGGEKCSTEAAVKDFYENNNYTVMRGEVAFWQGMFALAFYEEIFSKNVQTYNDIPSDLFSAGFYPNRKEEIDKKNEYLRTANISEFINEQLRLYNHTDTRLLRDTPISNSKDCIEYFQTPLVQAFLKRIDSKTFSKIIYRIAQNPDQNRAGTPDFVVWNDKKLFLVEVKREKEKIRPAQIAWIEFLCKNKIPVKVIRVKGVKI